MSSSARRSEASRFLRSGMFPTSRRASLDGAGGTPAPAWPPAIARTYILEAISGTASSAVKMPIIFQRVNCSCRMILASSTVMTG